MNAPFDVTGIKIETERLILREFNMNDLDDLFAYASVPDVGERAGWHHHENKDTSLRILKGFIEEKKTFAIVYKENNRVIGSIGIEKYGLEDKLSEFFDYQGREIGYVLAKDYWGRGLMPEAVKAVIDYLFNVLNYDFLLCGHYDFNNQSKRAQEKCGFKPYRKLVFETRMGTKEPGVLSLLKNPNKNIEFKFSHPETLIINETNNQNANQDYLNLVDFWNQNFKMSEEEKNELNNQINPDEDYLNLAPSQKQFDALEVFKDKEIVLDYGAGSGWASIIMAKLGTKKVIACDVAIESIKIINCYKEAFILQDKIEAVHISSSWLKEQKEGTYDGFFSSNVIDVVPLDMAKEIIKNAARVVKNDALLLFSLNYYIDPKVMEERGFVSKDKSIYIDGVLRLTSLTDEEWLEIFNQYFDLISLTYYAWPNESKETRRLFLLKKKMK